MVKHASSPTILYVVLRVFSKSLYDSTAVVVVGADVVVVVVAVVLPPKSWACHGNGNSRVASWQCLNACCSAGPWKQGADVLCSDRQHAV